MYRRSDALYHYGVKGMRWGVRRARRQNEKIDKSFKKWQENAKRRENATELGKKANSARMDYERDNKNKQLRRVYKDANKTYYIKDDDAHQIRYIFLDSIAPETSVTEYYTTQLNWMKERIQELQAGWNVIIVTHAIWANGTNDTAWGTALTNALDEIYDAVNANIIAVFSGHNHKDHMVVADKGYAIIATTADSTLSSEIGAAGTNTEQAFDVVNINLTTNTITLTRIGKGNDRSIVYNTKN